MLEILKKMQVSLAIKRGLQILSFLLLVTVGSHQLQAATAGAGHSHTASKSKVKRSAYLEVKRLVKANKIAESWLNATLVQSQKRENRWVVSFRNDEIQDAKKKVLYIYLTTYAKPKGANYTGK